MNPEIKAKWVTALRTGVLPNGTEIQQGKGFLTLPKHDGTLTSCCLGVLCEIAVDEGVLEVNNYGSSSRYRKKGLTTEAAYSNVILPHGMIEWAEFPTPPEGASTFETNAFEGYLPEPVEGHSRLTVLNDHEGYTFEQIADIIEEQY